MVFHFRAMSEGICLFGRRIRVAPKFEKDPSYYTYRNQLKAFEDRLKNDPRYIDSLLTPQQRIEKEKLLNEFDKSESNSTHATQERLLQYERHYQPEFYYNPILRRNINRTSFNNNHDESRYRRHSSDHYGQRFSNYNSNYFDTHQQGPYYRSQPEVYPNRYSNEFGHVFNTQEPSNLPTSHQFPQHSMSFNGHSHTSQPYFRHSHEFHQPPPQFNQNFPINNCHPYPPPPNGPF